MSFFARFCSKCHARIGLQNRYINILQKLIQLITTIYRGITVVYLSNLWICEQTGDKNNLAADFICDVCMPFLLQRGNIERICNNIINCLLYHIINIKHFNDTTTHSKHTKQLHFFCCWKGNVLKTSSTIYAWRWSSPAHIAVTLFLSIFSYNHSSFVFSYFCFTYFCFFNPTIGTQLAEKAAGDRNSWKCWNLDEKC